MPSQPIAFTMFMPCRRESGSEVSRDAEPRLMASNQVKSSGFSLVDLVVVLVMVGLLAGILLPALTIKMHDGSRKKNRGSNQRQIVLAMMVYQNDNDQWYPVYTATRDGIWVSPKEPGLNAVSTTLASIEFLAFFTGGDLWPREFSCTERPYVKPRSNAAEFNLENAIGAHHVRFQTHHLGETTVEAKT